MVRIYIFSLILLFNGMQIAQAQTPPKRELRAVWVATVKNLDWPSRSKLKVEEQKKEIRDLLDFHRTNGMNAIVMQVRPATDAFYFSAYEPWSEWLNGRQGVAPYPYYDPLIYFIEETHKRGMEFHAWFNPYRAATDYDSTKQLAPTHIVNQHPEWFLKHGANLYFDPGIPQVRDYVTEIILDVVNRYDVDAVHFDDYFYPYKIDNKSLPDTASFARYRGDFFDIGDWRRDNVNLFVQNLSVKIKDVKPWVKFGISPFSVWRNSSVDPEGSETRAGQTCYDDLYADIRYWLQEKWIDYIAPQLYFSIGYPLVSYDIALDWWRQNANGRHIYVGHGPYKINNNADKNWENPKEIPSQIDLNRAFGDVQGSVYFRAGSFKSNPLGLNDSLRNNYYRRPALIPLMPWLGKGPEPQSPNNLEATSQEKGVVLSWETTEQPNPPAYYAIYRFSGKFPGSLNSSEHLIDVIGGKTNFYVDKTVPIKGKYTYVVTSLNRLYYESGPDNPYALTKVKKKHILVESTATSKLRGGDKKPKRNDGRQITLKDLFKKN